MFFYCKFGVGYGYHSRLRLSVFVLRLWYATWLKKTANTLHYLLNIFCDVRQGCRLVAAKRLAPIGYTVLRQRLFGCFSFCFWVLFFSVSLIETTSKPVRRSVVAMCCKALQIPGKTQGPVACGLVGGFVCGWGVWWWGGGVGGGEWGGGGPAGVVWWCCVGSAPPPFCVVCCGGGAPY